MLNRKNKGFRLVLQSLHKSWIVYYCLFKVGLGLIFVTPVGASGIVEAVASRPASDGAALTHYNLSNQTNESCSTRLLFVYWLPYLK